MIILYKITVFIKRGNYLLKRRLAKLKSKMEEKNLDAIFISKPENIFYFSGFTGEGFLVVLQDSINLFTDFRYIEQAKKEASEAEIIDITTSLFKNFKNIIENYDIKNLGIESDYLTIENFYRLKEHLQNVNLIKAEDILKKLRIIKDSEEISAIKEAQMITDKTFSHIINHIRPGVTELELASEIDCFMKKIGAEKTSFETIVVSGKRSSLPHGLPSSKKLQIGDTITMDFGAKYAGYCADMTRTVFLGKPSKMQEKIFNIVLKAQEKALEYIKSGILGRDVDKKARNIIEDNGFGENFGHSLGHGVGIEIHEEPKLSKKSAMKLIPGMVVTIEPGIYIENSFGVRIEDLVVVTEKGCKNLTSSPKHIIVDV